MPELVLVLGPQRLPKVARNLGRGIREFKEAVTMDSDEYDSRERERELETKTGPRADDAAEPAPKA